jgi:hypothetical protein
MKCSIMETLNLTFNFSKEAASFSFKTSISIKSSFKYWSSEDGNGDGFKQTYHPSLDIFYQNSLAISNAFADTPTFNSF